MGKKHWPTKRRRRRGMSDERAIALSFVIVGGLALIWWVVARFWPIIVLVVLLVAGFFAYRDIKRRRRQRRTTSEIDKHLKEALEHMDTTDKWYRDEKEANKELVSCLKALHVGAEYQYHLPNGRIADARVGNVLIEGKLSPDTAEVDRLIGQLGAYCRYGKVNVVIFGHLSKEARSRIEDEIYERYRDRAFLTYLSKPRRHRALSAQTDEW
jgi:ABC-type multidrug transport system fused ATPase/permease subunit